MCGASPPCCVSPIPSLTGSAPHRPHPWSGWLVCRRSDKLDWMYQGGMVAKAEANKRMEDQQAAQPAQPSNVSMCKVPVWGYHFHHIHCLNLHLCGKPS